MQIGWDHVPDTRSCRESGFCDPVSKRRGAPTPGKCTVARMRSRLHVIPPRKTVSASCPRRQRLPLGTSSTGDATAVETDVLFAMRVQGFESR